MKSEMYRLLESEHRYWSVGQIKSVKDRKGARRSLRVKYLTDNGSVRFIARVANEDRLTRQIMSARRLIHVPYLLLNPTCTYQLVKELATALSGLRNAKHPEIAVGFGQSPRINGRKIGRESIIDLFSINQLPAFWVHRE